MPKAIDLTGQRFGRLVAKSVTKVDGRRKWVCTCDCGRTAVVAANKFTRGHTQSCGCLRRDRIAQATRKDYTGHRFGRLTVLDRISRPGQGTAYKCLCDCGRYTLVTSCNLITGATKSCGCLRSELISQTYTTHGGCRSRLYRTWQNMKNRCLNPHDKEYSCYGGRGIKICPEWLGDFAAFRDWAVSTGYTDEMQIDRIDPDKGYNPDNCQWLTPHEHGLKTIQDRRRRNNSDAYV